MIKGPKGTEVILSILRNSEMFDVAIVRDRIVVKNVEMETISSEAIVIDINMFSVGVYEEFLQQLQEQELNSRKRVIIDLTNNPGGSLQEVMQFLDHFVPTGEVSMGIQQLNRSQDIVAEAVDPDLFLGNKEIVVLINKGSASAAEIMAGVIQEYVPQSILIGETTFGK